MLLMSLVDFPLSYSRSHEIGVLSTTRYHWYWTWVLGTNAQGHFNKPHEQIELAPYGAITAKWLERAKKRLEIDDTRALWVDLTFQGSVECANPSGGRGGLDQFNYWVSSSSCPSVSTFPMSSKVFRWSVDKNVPNTADPSLSQSSNNPPNLLNLQYPLNRDRSNAPTSKISRRSRN